MGENYFGITDPGRQRDNNEDSFIAQTVFNKTAILACVIDGVGGYAGGEVAAKLTRDTIIRHFKKLPENTIAAMVSALESANASIFKEKQIKSQFDKMACVVTLAIADPEKNKFSYAHVGDTRLYLFRDSSLVKVTNDHSTVGFLEESGRLTETAAMQHPKRNEVNKALGYEANMPLPTDFFDTGESPFLPGDTILICSDGLTDMIPSSAIISILNNGADLKTRATQLIAAANEAGGKDNVTVVLVYNDKLPAKLEIAKPLVAAKNNDHDTVVLNTTAEKSEINLSEPVVNTKKKKSSMPGWLLFFILLIAAAAWFWFNSKQNSREPKLIMPPVPAERNAGERNLSDSINAASTFKIISLIPGQAVVITDSIFIDKDSLYIKGNGANLTSDSAYKGPAFILSAKCKYLLLDSLMLTNFSTGILVHNKGLHLKNVRFNNCAVPVQFNQQLAQNSFISGTQADPVFNQTDSLSK